MTNNFLGQCNKKQSNLLVISKVLFGDFSTHVLNIASQISTQVALVHRVSSSLRNFLKSVTQFCVFYQSALVVKCACRWVHKNLP